MNLKNIFSRDKTLYKKINYALVVIVTLGLMYLGYQHNNPLRENIVIIRIFGGLGNQLFRYSAAYAFAKKTNSKLYVLLSSKEYYSGENNSNTTRYFDLEKFGVSKDQIIFRDSKLLKKIYKYRKKDIINIGQDNFFNFDKNKGKKVYFLDGCFEAIKYFENLESEIRRLFNVQHLVSDRTKDLVKKLRERNAVCIHVRLGDWVSHGGELNNSYYLNALEIINHKIKYPRFYVFSDDIVRTKDKFKDFNNLNYIDDKNLLPIDDFFLMANCANNINSQSTFSWWASFTNHNLDRIVISPFKNINADFEIYGGHDKAPKNWILIKTF